MPARPRLTPAMADVRRAVRSALASAFPEAATNVVRNPSCGLPGGWVIADDAPLVLVALSGGPDSLALAAATAFESAKCGVRAGAIIVDHQLQRDSETVAQRASEQAKSLGLSPVLIEQATVLASSTGPEADARTARYAAIDAVAARTGAVAVMLGHSMDDQAESVLLGLARGSGARSLSGMRSLIWRENRPAFLRPLLGLRRDVLAQACADQGLEPWHDPHNLDPAYTRVRVRSRVLPVLASELGEGIVEALARTAEQLDVDAEALESLARQALESAKNRPETATDGPPGHELRVDALAELATAVRRRVLFFWLTAEGATDISSSHIEIVDDLVTNWHGQVGCDLPGVRVIRESRTLRAVR